MVDTAWQREERIKKQQEEERQENERRRAQQKELLRIQKIDQEQDNFIRAVQRTRQVRANKDVWSRQPDWVKSLPLTPMTAPPTQGRKQKILYSMTGKVTLTDEERAHRVAQQKKVLQSMNLYGEIHRKLPGSVPQAIVPVIPLGRSCGTTTTVRMIVRALSESRYDLDTTAAIDFAGQGSSLSSWFGGSQQYTMRSLFNFINRDVAGVLGISEVFAPGRKGEYFLENLEEKKKRKEVDIDDVYTLLSYIRPSGGTVIIDCDYAEDGVNLTSALLSQQVIFLSPPDSQSEEELRRVTQMFRNVFGDEDYKKLMEKSKIVTPGVVPDINTKKGIRVVSGMQQKLCETAGIPGENKFIIPYDKHVELPPLHWTKIQEKTRTALRQIAAHIISSVVGPYKGSF